MDFIRLLGPDDAPAAVALRREAPASEPLAFGASLDDDTRLTADAMAASLADTDRLPTDGH